MGTPPSVATYPRSSAEAIEQARRLFTEAEGFEARRDTARYAAALRGFLGFVEANRKGLDVAGRCVDAGLLFAPSSASLLHHKALILLAQNRSVDQALPLVDQALAANP